MTALDIDITGRIPELETWFDHHDISWVFNPAFPVDGIDHLAGLANQARLQPLDEAVVDRYTADMEAGAQFPAVVLRLVTVGHRESRVAVGGNHRTAAARKSGRATLAAYLVECDDDQAHLLAIEDNRRHGLPLSDEERLYHAVSLVNSGRHTATEAAGICGLAPTKLQAQLTANRGAQRAIRLDVDGWAALSTTSRAKCASIRDDGMFARVIPLVANSTILAAEVTDVVARLNVANPQQAAELLDALELDARQRTRRTTGHPVSRLRAPATRLLHDLDGILNYQAVDVAADCNTPEQRQRLANQIKAAARRLMAIDKELWG